MATEYKIAIILGSAHTQVSVVPVRRDFILIRRRIFTFANTNIQNFILFTGLVDFVEISFKNPTHHPLVDSHRWLLFSALLILR